MLALLLFRHQAPCLSPELNRDAAMPEKWIGLVASRNDVIAVEVEVPDDDGPLVIQADLSWPLQRGERPTAYQVLHQQVADYCRERRITRGVVKESAVNRAGTTKAHLESAEVRGVVIAAAATAAATEVVAKAKVSRTFGTRNADAYLRDNEFWGDQIEGDLRMGSREAVLILLAVRNAP
jgi:hypothetical protein